MWVARISNNLGKLHDYDLSPYFKNVQDCSNYIHQNLAVIEFLLSECFYRVNNHHFEKGKEVDRITISFGSFVRPYNVEQNRFCDGFDF